jgi:DUF2934 family protein
MAHTEDTLDRIRKRAYELWELEGRKEGQETANWVRATTEILSESKDTREIKRTEDIGNPYDRTSAPEVKPQ